MKTWFEAKSCCSLFTDLPEDVTCPRSFIKYKFSGYTSRIVKHWLIRDKNKAKQNKTAFILNIIGNFVHKTFVYFVGLQCKNLHPETTTKQAKNHSFKVYLHSRCDRHCKSP